MAIVIQRKADLKFLRGRNRSVSEWVANIDEARTYDSPGSAKNSLKQITGGPYWLRRREAFDFSAYELVTIKITRMDYFERLVEDSLMLEALNAAGVDNWEGISEARRILREELNGDDE